jgi:hypothetical protein
VEAVNYLHRIAGQLDQAARELENAGGRCCCPAGSYDRGSVHDKGCPHRNPTLEHLWARHLADDANSLRLLAEAASSQGVGT